MSETDNAWADFVKRHRSGETNAVVARKLSVDPSTVGRWVNGFTQPTPQQAISFARIYGVHPVEALVAAGYLSPSDVEGKVTIQTTATLEAFSTRALVEELGDRLDVMSQYAGWIKAADSDASGHAHMADQALRYVDPATPPYEVKVEPFKHIFGERLRETAALDGVPLYNVSDVGGTDEDENLHGVDLTKEQHDLAASEDDTVVNPDR